MRQWPQGRGYTQLQETGAGHWPLLSSKGHPLYFNAHEFHYSRIENLPMDTQFAYEVLRGKGIDGKHDGIVYKNLLASYTHLRHATSNPWADRFVAFMASCKQPVKTVVNSAIPFL